MLLKTSRSPSALVLASLALLLVFPSGVETQEEIEYRFQRVGDHLVPFTIVGEVDALDRRLAQSRSCLANLPGEHIKLLPPIYVVPTLPGSRTTGGGFYPVDSDRRTDITVWYGREERTGIPDNLIDDERERGAAGIVAVTHEAFQDDGGRRFLFTLVHEAAHAIQERYPLVPSETRLRELAQTYRTPSVREHAADAYSRYILVPWAVCREAALPPGESRWECSGRVTDLLRRSEAFDWVPEEWRPATRCWAAGARAEDPDPDEEEEAETPPSTERLTLEELYLEDLFRIYARSDERLDRGPFSEDPRRYDPDALGDPSPRRMRRVIRDKLDLKRDRGARATLEYYLAFLAEMDGSSAHKEQLVEQVERRLRTLPPEGEEPGEELPRRADTDVLPAGWISEARDRFSIPRPGASSHPTGDGWRAPRGHMVGLVRGGEILVDRFLGLLSDVPHAFEHIGSTLAAFEGASGVRRDEIDLPLVLAKGIRESGAERMLSRSDELVVSAGREVHPEGASGLDYLYAWRRRFPASIRSELRPVPFDELTEEGRERSARPAPARLPEKHLLAAFVVAADMARQRSDSHLRRGLADLRDARVEEMLDRRSPDARRAWTQLLFGSPGRVRKLLRRIRSTTPDGRVPDLDRIVTDDALLDLRVVGDASLLFGIQRARITAAEARLLERFFAERDLFGF